MNYSIVGYLGYKEGVGDISFESEKQFVDTAEAAVNYYMRRELTFDSRTDKFWEIEDCIQKACADNCVKVNKKESLKILFSSSVA